MSVVVRERRAEDLPVLVEVLAAQQASSATRSGGRCRSRSGISWSSRAERAWVAEAGRRGRRARRRLPALGQLRDRSSRALGTDELAEVAVLFVAPTWSAPASAVGSSTRPSTGSSSRPGGGRCSTWSPPARALDVYRHRGWRSRRRVRPVWLATDFPALVLMALSDPAPVVR